MSIEAGPLPDLRQAAKHKMDRRILTARLDAPISRIETVQMYCRGKRVLDIGCVHHDACQADNAAWLHQAIADVAAYTLGVDYVEQEVSRLKERGYNVMTADVTQPLALDQQFDVIVVGNLIEHLSNFEGLFSNIRRLMKKDGCALISTANPFFREQYFYTAFKNDIIVNPEHTCWIDPVTLDQLSRRCGFATQDVYWVKEKWKLGQMILNGERRWYDMFTGRWVFEHPPSAVELFVSCILEQAFKALCPREFTRRIYDEHGSNTRRLLYLKFIERLFQPLWAFYAAFIVSSALNRHELFVSVLRHRQ